MTRRYSDRSGYSRVIATGVFIFLAIAAWFFIPRNSAIAGEPVSDGDEPITFVDDIETPAENQDFSKFSHSSAQHARMPCLLCHKRRVGLFTPKMPGHTPCAGCHVQQFADNQNQICIICHTATSVKPFPRIQSFGVTFNHAIHTKQTGCATCHKPTRAGVALSLPSGGTAHTSCFQCHGPLTEIGGRNIGSCGVCHIPGRLAPVSANAKAYSINFSHTEHTRKGMSCSVCHTVQAGSRRGGQVTTPAAAMHFAPAGRTSCATCHNNKRAFGPPDFNDCKRCHEGNGFKFR